MTPPFALVQKRHGIGLLASLGSGASGHLHDGQLCAATSSSFSPACMMLLAKMKKPGRSSPSTDVPPIPVPSPPPLLTITSPQSPSVPITVRFPLALEAVVASFVRRVSSMLKMRPGLVILMGCKSSSPSTKAVLRTAKPSCTIMSASRL